MIDPITNWHVQVGAGDPTSPTEVDRFYPSALTVHPGDTVDFASGGFHTVTFNPVPAPISAYLGGPGGLSAPGPLATPTTFVTALPDFSNPTGPPPDFILGISMSLPSGTYHYQCMIHKVMQATLRVTRGEIERTDAQNMALAARHMAEDVEALNRFDSRLSRRSGAESVLVGAGQGALSSLKIYPSSSTIRSGERINFTNADPNEPHTTSFGFAKPPLRPPGEAYPSSCDGPVRIPAIRPLFRNQVMSARSRCSTRGTFDSDATGSPPLGSNGVERSSAGSPSSGLSVPQWRTRVVGPPTAAGSLGFHLQRLER